MQFVPTQIQGAFVVEPEAIQDERGLFARTFCAKEFEGHGLESRFVQCNVSFNHERGTLRGLHYQAAPREECKLVRCTAGSIFDVIVDVREGSTTEGRWFGVELSARNRKALYVPAGAAHGFLTLEASTEVFYQMSEFYSPDLSKGYYWGSPDLGIAWPIPPKVISERDAGLPVWCRRS